MFDKKVAAEAQVLSDEGSGSVIDTDMHGVHWDHNKYIPRSLAAGKASGTCGQSGRGSRRPASDHAG